MSPVSLVFVSLVSTCMLLIVPCPVNGQSPTPRDGTPNLPVRYGVSPSMFPHLNLSWIHSYFQSNGVYLELTQTINPVNDLMNNFVDIIDLDGSMAYLIAKKYGADVLVAEETGENLPYYQAAIWVKANSGITNIAQLKGTRSCHTGYLKSAGMFMPIGYLLRQPNSGLNYTLKSSEPAIDSPQASLLNIVTNYFATTCAPPTRAGDVGICTGCDKKTGCDASDKYADYFGALRGLMDGVCDVAFARSSTWNDMCAPSPHNDTCIHCNNSACIPTGPLHSCACQPRSEVRMLTSVGRVPSHSLLYIPNHITQATIQTLISTFTQASKQLFCPISGPCQRKRYLSISPAAGSTRAQTHLGDIGANSDAIPGLNKYICPSCVTSTNVGSPIVPTTCGVMSMLFALVGMNICINTP